jgi:outer membrane protein TolC
MDDFRRWCLALLVLGAIARAVSAQPAPFTPPAQPAVVEASCPIDLASALRLAGVQNPEILLARERVTEAVAVRQLAAAQILPSVNAGFNYDNHTGNLQRAVGTIQPVNRDSLYLGLGASAVGAGTVQIPGLVLHGNVAEGIFANLVARQVVRQRQFANDAVRNDVLLRAAAAYLELLRADGRVAVITQSREEAREVTRVTANYAKTGQGRQADADRAATELEQRETELSRAEGDALAASARLCELLSLDPATRLRPTDASVVPAPVVPDPIPVAELIAIAVAQRPELAERQAAVRAAFLELRGAKLLPFSPTAIVGFSAGSFGGGSDVAAAGGQPRFDSFGGRTDFDVVLYWTLRNLGVGNIAQIKLARSNLRTSDLRLLETLDRVRAEVAAAYARTHARFAQIDSNERAVRASTRAFDEDLRRTRNREGLPIEVLDSLRLLARSRVAYLDAIIDYNRAQFELYVALGQPPAEQLARPVPPELVSPVEKK